MTERKVPNLAELERLERKVLYATALAPEVAGHWPHALTVSELDSIGDQLRPLLDLVDGMGKALEMARDWSGRPDEHGEATFSVVAFNEKYGTDSGSADTLMVERVDAAHTDWQRAKGGSP